MVITSLVKKEENDKWLLQIKMTNDNRFNLLLDAKEDIAEFGEVGMSFNVTFYELKEAENSFKCLYNLKFN